ncbi:MAG: 30S ribosomal protein S19 [Candidatus Bipolaricaulaceae bacterium]
MVRPSKKGPYVHPKLVQKVERAKRGEISEIRTWSRASMVTPDMVGMVIRVHNGRSFVPVRVTEAMIGHRLGEFAPTRTFRGHGGARKKAPTPK